MRRLADAFGIVQKAGVPPLRQVRSRDWTLDQFSATTHATCYGDVTQPGATPAGDTHTGRNMIVDLEVRYRPVPSLGLAIGANNLFDVYPDALSIANNSTCTVAFPYCSPFGCNGRYLHGRVDLPW